MSLALVLLSLLACTRDVEDTGDPTADPTAGDLTRREDGWLRGDLHMHSTWSDGWDDVATVVAIAESLEDPTFVAAHPEYEGRGLDFMALTDHRTFDAWSDPAYTSDRLILLGGEEWGSSSHAGAWGITALVEHDPDGDGLDAGDIARSIAETHAQGGAFSPNHPFSPGIPFPWDVRGHDAIEVWNAGWSLMSQDVTQETLVTWEASHGPASPMYRRAVQERGGGSAYQSLKWYEAQLSRGIHVALVGGSDRHALLPVGSPTTWVQADQPDIAGVIAGIKARHTFVARSPVGPQLAVEVDYLERSYAMGDAIPLGDSAQATVRVRVARAQGARVLLIAGGAVSSDEALVDAPLGAVLVEEQLTGDRGTIEATVALTPGAWFYPLVLEPLFEEGATAQQREELRALAQTVADVGDESFLDLASALLPYVDTDVLWDGSQCDPDAWEPDQLQCMTADADGLATFWAPDAYNRVLNAWTEDGQVTDWCVGAVGSAVRFAEVDR
ncbi:MAG: CehA/McbA family metallohydrolase [Deltaproteobacteria bacterium]|nr:CehA/McbA family metallohydrolase [Deltaproteobacteria bacterium]